jgi:hypothetical protein
MPAKPPTANSLRVRAQAEFAVTSHSQSLSDMEEKISNQRQNRNDQKSKRKRNQRSNLAN